MSEELTEEVMQAKIKMIIKIICLSKNVKLGDLEKHLGLSVGMFSRMKFSLYNLYRTCNFLQIDFIETIKLAVEGQK